MNYTFGPNNRNFGSLLFVIIKNNLIFQQTAVLLLKHCLFIILKERKILFLKLQKIIQASLVGQLSINFNKNNQMTIKKSTIAKRKNLLAVLQ